MLKINGKMVAQITSTTSNTHRRCNLQTHEPKQHGAGLTEYLVVLAGLAIVWTGIEIALELIRQHNENYSEALKLIY